MRNLARAPDNADMRSLKSELICIELPHTNQVEHCVPGGGEASVVAHAPPELQIEASALLLAETRPLDHDHSLLHFGYHLRQNRPDQPACLALERTQENFGTEAMVDGEPTRTSLHRPGDTSRRNWGATMADRGVP